MMECKKRRKRPLRPLIFFVPALLSYEFGTCEAFLVPSTVGLRSRFAYASHVAAATSASSSFPNQTTSPVIPQSNSTFITAAPNNSTNGAVVEDLNGRNDANGTPNDSKLFLSKENHNGLTSDSSSTSTMFESLTPDDLKQIDGYWDLLMPAVNYLGTKQVAKIFHGLVVSYKAHKGQLRKSGEPFVIHPVQVALLLAGLKMDCETVIAGLLHDTVEDTDMTFGQVEELFGSTVRTIVEGETKVSKLPKMVAEYAQSEDEPQNQPERKDDEQAENLRQMFVAMTEDYRIIIVKLADRLHNMRTLRHMKPEKKIKISRETLDIFAPLAHRMGIWQFKSELEDTAFMYLYPHEYKRLNRRLRMHQTKYRETLDKSQAVLQRQLDSDCTLAQQAAKIEVQGRTKELYSLWHKMEMKGVSNLDNISDVVALRVVITPRDTEDTENNHQSEKGVWLCYHVLGLVQHLPGFQPVPTGVKDYISFPKPNGYQSLHTALILNGQTIEVQIRTSYMHQVAEYGMASHWAYTQSKRNGSTTTTMPQDEFYFTPWLSSIKEWQKDRISSRDFVDSVRRELLGKRVFVFLRNGKILNLARGATAIDAAFQIHTEVGLSMYGVEINGKPVPFSYELQNGDLVSVLTGHGGRPATDWMRHAKSRSTRSKLRSYFRSQQRESMREAGIILLNDYLRNHGDLIRQQSFLDEDFAVPTEATDLEDFLIDSTRYQSLDDLLESIGSYQDRDQLHKTIAQIFKVPKRVLINAETDRPSTMSMADAVQEQRLRALDSASASAVSFHEGSERMNSVWDFRQDEMIASSLDHLLSGLGLRTEDADPEQICPDCLPVFGDSIVGTCSREDESITMVHRVGCQHAQTAINRAQADLKSGNVGNERVKPLPIDSVTLRRQNGNVLEKALSKRGRKYDQSGDDLMPVRLRWTDSNIEDNKFLSEIVVHCQDRKLLLADCSEVVSETAEIFRTGSQTTQEHATLVFLVEVSGIHQLQQLMDRLGQVRSVMSVERRFGSELL